MKAMILAAGKGTRVRPLTDGHQFGVQIGYSFEGYVDAAGKVVPVASRRSRNWCISSMKPPS